MHKTRDCVAGLFLFAPQFALGARDTRAPTLPATGVPCPSAPLNQLPNPRFSVAGVLWLPARAHKIAIFQQSFIDPPKHYTGWYVVLTLAAAVVAGVVLL